MIDLNALRENPKEIGKRIKQKDPDFAVQKLLELDKNVREIRLQIEELRHTKNELAQKAKSGITPEIRNESIAIGKLLKEKEQELQIIETAFQDLYFSCPNIPAKDIPVGDKTVNTVIRKWKEKQEFGFPVKNHLELGEQNNWLDFDAAVKTTGSQFALYKGDMVKLLYSLATFMFKHNIQQGYEPILPPYLVNQESLFVTGNFPKFKDDVYAIQEENLYLTPTAEVNLANMFRGHIFQKKELPVRTTAWTSCFRKEAGGYGATERGLIRIHQFEKVELFILCLPEQVNQEQEKMLSCAESILQALGLHYRVSLLATQDCSFASAKTFDLEVWLPGQNQYYEVSSISNCTDFQARRGLIRFKETEGSKPQLVYTLNGSSVALSRLMVALLEVYQQKDGSVFIPQVLQEQGFFKKGQKYLQ